MGVDRLMNYGIRVVETLFLLNFIDQMGTNKIYISEICLISMSVESTVLARPRHDDKPHAGGYIFANIEAKMVWFRAVPFFFPFLVDF
jgi:hypothetical protein